MQPVEFQGTNMVFGKDQPEYLPLPVKHHGDIHGHITSCWQLSDEEFDEIARTRKVYVTVMSFNKPLQPQMVTVGVPEL